MNTSTKYFAEYHRNDQITYTSVLLINDISTSDYGAYECGARNDLGFGSVSVKLDVTGPPGERKYLLNITFNIIMDFLTHISFLSISITIAEIENVL